MTTETTMTTAHGLSFQIRVFRFGDGWTWSAHAHDVAYDACRLRSWANPRLAHEDAVATLEREFA